MGKLFIRADAGARIGAGHFMRCLALAQEAERSGLEVAWASHCPVPKLREETGRLKAKAFWLESPALETASLESFKPDWAVFDGYQFDLACQKAVRSAGAKLLLVDDCRHHGRYEADAILNQNIGAEKLAYSCNDGCKLLLGLKHCLLRREFVESRKEPGRERTPLKALLTFGGSDPENATLRLMETLETAACGAEFGVLLGAANPRRKEIEGFAAKAKTAFKVLEASSKMPELLAGFDLAVSAAGSTCWELAFMSKPMAVLSVAENQDRNAEGLGEAGAALNLGRIAELSPERAAKSLKRLLSDASYRRGLAAKARELVDGQGAKRVLRSIFPELEKREA